ncbi:hypothetical protein ROK90_12920 [Cronobacter dublinensis]|uniref:hypothetical protein n=1 Tax=Cronobacter dublinensis TaxID=413497 RepID=UPI0023DD258C|nr:hypothetical protein [Cronobacter dublinensis]MDT3666900.1 hypothetical protein [Cronobacter dublinensis]WEP44780.1 hypothetical protein NNQ27_18555 [Cronobacter dublinensis]
MKKIFFLFLLLLPALTVAGTWPVITSVTPTPAGGGWNYNYTLQVLEVGPAVDVYGSGMIALGHRHNPKTENTFAVAGDDSFIANLNGWTIGKVATFAYNPNVHSVWHMGQSPDGDECVAYAYIPGETRDTAYSVPFSSVQIPGGCMKIPPLNQWCKITSPEIVLDHGTITLQDAEGHSAQTKVNVNCSTSMSVSFSLVTNEPYLLLSPAGKSTITIADKPLGSAINIQSGASSLTVKDMLSGVNTTGVSSASTVLFMMPY